MRKPKERPSIIFRKQNGKPVPATAFDAELWDAVPERGEVEGKRRTKRSWPQLQLYWSILSRVVAATDIAPSALYLHDLIKVELGYVTLVRLLDGRLVEWPDSAALTAMDAETFSHFFDAAMKLLAERCGFDPMDT